MQHSTTPPSLLSGYEHPESSFTQLCDLEMACVCASVYVHMCVVCMLYVVCVCLYVCVGRCGCVGVCFMCIGCVWEGCFCGEGGVSLRPSQHQNIHRYFYESKNHTICLQMLQECVAVAYPICYRGRKIPENAKTFQLKI